MSKELEYFQEIIKMDKEALTLANKEKSKKRDVMLHRRWLNQRKNSIEQALKEHEQYKAIEQELGIDLITLIKTLKEPVYVIINNKIVKTYCGHIGEECKTIDFEIDGKDYKNLYDIETFYVLTKDYGKTWALTREELE